MSGSDSSTPSAFRVAAIKAWQNNGSRRTQVREALCDIIGELDTPFTAETLLPIARRIDGGISMASVYRTLGDLKEFGLLHETRGAQNEMCFSVVDPTKADQVQNSATVVCRDCGHLQQVDDPCLAVREGPLAKQAGFNLRKLDLRMEADCDTMHKTGTCEHRPPAPAES